MCAVKVLKKIVLARRKLDFLKKRQIKKATTLKAARRVVSKEATRMILSI